MMIEFVFILIAALLSVIMLYCVNRYARVLTPFVSKSSPMINVVWINLLSLFLATVVVLLVAYIGHELNGLMGTNITKSPAGGGLLGFTILIMFLINYFVSTATLTRKLLEG